MKKVKKRILRVLLVLAMLTMLPTEQAVAASLEDNITYINYNESTNQFESTIQSNVTVITSETTELTSGWYVTSGSETAINSCVTVSGDVHLILKDGCTLNCEQGIIVSGDNSLTIYGQSSGTGTLNAIGQSGGHPGIGVNDGTLGTIAINGGVVNATGTFHNEMSMDGGVPYIGAGVGGSAGYYGSITTGGTVVINGGQVTANGGYGWSSGYNRSAPGILAESFSTGAKGNAIINTNYGISDKSQQNTWSGIIFEGSSGAVYGDQTLARNFTVESGNTLTISSDAKLTVPQGVSFTNSGTLNIVGGDMECSGSLTNNGTLNVGTESSLSITGTLINSGTATVDGVATCDSIQNSGVISISGSFSCNGGTNTGLIYNNGTFTNTGTISGENGYVVSATQVDGVGEQLITSDKMFYLNEDGEKTYLTADDAIYPLTAADHTWKKQFGKNTWYLAIKDLTIDDGVKLEDDVNLILMDGVTLTINGKNDNGGINAENHTLNIYAQSYGDGMGTLKATGGHYNWMAIGGSNANINIKGGFIEAGFPGDECYSGIGPGRYQNLGNLTITGGIIKTKTIGASKVGDATGGLAAPAGSSAVIYTLQTEVNSSKVSGFNGIIFLQEKGSVYGNAKLVSDLTVEENETLTIPSGTTLTVPSGTTLTINGKLVIEGTLVVEGKLVNNATLIKGTGSGSVTMKGWTYGDTANTPTATSNTNGTENVTYKYKVKDATQYLTGIPTNAGEYTVEATFAATDFYNEYTAIADFTISQKELTVNAKVQNKTYNGLNTATFDGTPTLNGTEKNDDVTLVNGTPTFTSVNVGENIAISFTEFTLEGNDASNYKLTQPSGIKANITAKPLTINPLGIAAKFYDGTNKASFSPTPKLVGVESGDEVTLVDGVPTFSTVAVGRDIPINFTDFTLDGADKDNYTLVQPTGITAEIGAYFAGGSEYTTTTTDWTNQNFVVTASSGWLVSETNTAEGTWSDSLTRSAETGSTGDSLTFYVKNINNGIISVAITKTYRIDKTVPVISGAEDNKTYCAAVTLTITDDNLESVSINGKAATLTESGTLTLEPAAGAQSVVATDKAGNSTTLTVTVNDGHTWGAWTSNGNNTHSRTCALDTTHTETASCHGGKATCTDKAVCDDCKLVYGELDPNNHAGLKHVEAKAATTTTEGNIEYWFCTGCDKYFASESGHDEITEPDTVIKKLPVITKGDNAKVTQGASEPLSFTSDADFADFLCVEVDGKTLDSKHYSLASGSTVVTLNANYVATLAAGEHVLGIVSQNGTATASFTVDKKAEEITPAPDKPTTNTSAKTSPQTGDSAALFVWLTLLLVSGSATTITALVGRKRKNN